MSEIEPTFRSALFDSHCHFETADEEEIAAILKRARAAGVGSVMAVGGSDKLNGNVAAAYRAAAALGDAAPWLYRAIGYDRDQAATPFESLPPLDLANIHALGEIGLDYHYDEAPRHAQRELFARELEIARAANLPVIIHTRDADDDTLAILREIPSRGVIHCFTGSPDFCRRLLDLGFFISISGIVTFRAAENVRESSRVIPLDRLLIETDSPFLAPVPLRGKANEPAFIVHTARFLAGLRAISPDLLASTTTANAEKIFSSPSLSP